MMYYLKTILISVKLNNIAGSANSIKCVKKTPAQVLQQPTGFKQIS